MTDTAAQGLLVIVALDWRSKGDTLLKAGDTIYCGYIATYYEVVEMRRPIYECTTKLDDPMFA